MGTTLTGTTPQDTYDSLIKVTDNGPLSGTAKYLSDGLGNDSILALSTARVGIGTTSPNSTFKVTINSGTNINSFLNGDKLSFSRTSDNVTDVVYLSRTNDLGANGTANIQGYDGIQFRTLGPEGVKMTITSTGNVGIGTTPSGILSFKDVYQSTFYRNANFGTSLLLSADAGSDQRTWQFSSRNQSTRVDLAVLRSTNGTTYGSSPTGLTYAEIARFTENGLTFNGDTAAANALDDYEEGTWTMGVTFGGASVGVTYAVNTGTYTKIGRQVTVNGFLELTNKGSSTGAAKITGLPFTIANTNSNISAPTLRYESVTFINQFQGYGPQNTTTINLEEITSLGVRSDLTNSDFSNISQVSTSFTYFV